MARDETTTHCLQLLQDGTVSICDCHRCAIENLGVVHGNVYEELPDFFELQLPQGWSCEWIHEFFFSELSNSEQPDGLPSVFRHNQGMNFVCLEHICGTFWTRL
jgi:hypothetical protein